MFSDGDSVSVYIDHAKDVYTSLHTFIRNDRQVPETHLMPTQQKQTAIRNRKCESTPKEIIFQRFDQCDFSSDDENTDPTYEPPNFHD